MDKSSVNFIKAILWMTASGIGVLNFSFKNPMGVNFSLGLLIGIGIYNVVDLLPALQRTKFDV